MDKLVHMLLHLGAHAFHNHQHKQHRLLEAERERYHRLSPFSRLAYELLRETGYPMISLDEDTAVYQFRGRAICLTVETGEFRCLGATPYKVHRSYPSDLERQLDGRNSSLKFGSWYFPRIGDHWTLCFRVTIEPGAINIDTFKYATAYVFDELNEVCGMMARAGYRAT